MTTPAPFERIGFRAPIRGVVFGTSTRAPALPKRPFRPAVAVQRHLILAYRPKWQSIEDLNTVAAHVRDLDPRIATFLAPTTHRNPITRKAAAKLPTLVVSPGRMVAFQPLRGKVYQGWPIPKVEEVRLLEAGGVPVPRTAVLTPDLRLDEADWGEFVILKPTDIGTSSQGLGIQLIRTRRVHYIAPKDYPPGHPGQLGPMIVQEYIHTGERVAICRVLTLFGEPLYILDTEAAGGRVDLTASDEVIEATPIANQQFKEAVLRRFIDDQEAAAVARLAYRALPGIPLQGVDVIRDARTGKLYVLETNAGGNTWHFSSSLQAESRRKNGAEFERQRRYQMDALRTAARVLVAKTNSDAV